MSSELLRFLGSTDDPTADSSELYSATGHKVNTKAMFPHPVDEAAEVDMGAAAEDGEQDNIIVDDNAGPSGANPMEIIDEHHHEGWYAVADQSDSSTSSSEDDESE